MNIISRFKEPSTWAGLASLGVLFGLNVQEVGAIANAGAGLAGLLAVFLAEKPGA